jgi:hypothetical protein
MALGPLVTYVPPGVYTRTLTEANAANLVAGLRIPVIVGVGQEQLTQSNLELIRGSSANLDQQILSENASSRFVLSEANPSNPTLGAADGLVSKLRVRNFPIVDGNGFGRITNDVRSVSVSINGLQVAVGAVQGSSGYVTLQVPPQPGDDVRVTYFFRRTDTAFTDNVSDQVTQSNAEITTPGVGPFAITSSTTELVIIVDGIESSITLPAGSLSAASLKTQVDSNLIAGLATAVFTDNQGAEHLTFIAAKEVEMGAGSANAVLGFTEGNKTGRNKAFRVFQRPIVDGTDGGITTNDTSKVTVLVDGVQQIPTHVDGTNGLVTLALPPAPSAVITIEYFGNTWQDTFDYLPNTLVTDVVRCGFATGRSDFIEGQDFVIENPSSDVSVIHWGASVSVANLSTTAGATAFDGTQILPTLVDDKLYMAATTRYVNTGVVPAAIAESEFILPEVPTTGNGRDTPLGQALYTAVANNRISLPSNRPDLVQAWAGVTVKDALARPALTVTEVDAATRRIKVREVVPPDQTVYATFNYSRIGDDSFTLTNKVAGSLNTGEFELRSAAQGRNLHQVRFGTKTSLPETVQWPRGAELTPDAFHHGGTPVNETVTVTFGSSLATNARFTNDGQAPFDIFGGTSDLFRTTINGTAFAVDLDVTANARLVSARIPVNGSDQVVFTTANNQLNLTIDGTDVDVTFAAASTTITAAVAAINAAIDLVDESGSGGIDFTATAPNNLASFQRIGAAGGDHVIQIASSLATSALPAGFDEDHYVAIRPGTAETVLGFATFQRANATIRAVNKPATYVGTLPGPFNITLNTNDALNIQVDGIDYSVQLTAGVAVTTATLVSLINGVPGLSGVASVNASGPNAQRLRLTSPTNDTGSRVVIKEGSANAVLGLTTGDEASQTRVEAQEIVNVINAFSGLAAEGFARVKEIEGRDFITIESIDTGTASTIAFVDGANSAFNITTGLRIVPGTDGDSGEAASDIFTVTSSHVSGSAGTGTPGQTYTDARTGLRFTILPSATGDYSSGSFTMSVTETWKVNPSIPYLSVPGLELIVTDTLGVGLNNTAKVQTFNPGGIEPAIGDSYFITYRYMKQDFSTRLFAQFRTIEANFGPLSAENRVTLAAFLMILNGAVLVGIKQVLKAPNTNQASDVAFVTALKELEKPLAGNVKPDVLVPLSTSTVVYSQIMQHVEVQSTLRNQSERMAYIGFASGTGPTTAQTVARSLESNRVVACYPDSAVVTLTDELGNNFETLVDGTFLAAAVAGSAVSPAFDVATPFTRRRIQGFTRLPRILDAVEANLTATSGVTLLEDLAPIIRIRQGLTTDMSTILTRLPTVTQIADFVQQSARSTLDVFIGTKFLASRTNDVEVSLTSMFNSLVQAEIVGAFTGISATVDPDDPTVLRVESYYQPIFPLLYIVVTFNLRSRI